MTDPLTDYLRFEMDLAVRGNIPAGEDIRLIWPDGAAAAGLPDHDFWIFDGHTVAAMRFDEDGLAGVDILTGASANLYRRWSRTAWEHSLPFDAYTAAAT